MKIDPELAAILNEASDEVETWEPWQRSLDPIYDTEVCKTPSS